MSNGHIELITANESNLTKSASGTAGDDTILSRIYAETMGGVASTNNNIHTISGGGAYD